jgi:hypothetical protein
MFPLSHIRLFFKVTLLDEFTMSTPQLFPKYMQEFNKMPRMNRFQRPAHPDAPVESGKRAIRHQLAFILDATGSMSSYIEGTKDHIKKMVDECHATTQKLLESQLSGDAAQFELKFEVAIVCYEDFCDRTIFQTLDFTTDLDEFRRFLSAIHAGGGGDGPEDVLGGFVHALYGITEKEPPLSWDARGEVAVRTLIWLADAPPHGEGVFHIGGGDDHPDPMTDYWDVVFKKISQLKLSLNVIKITGYTDVANAYFKALAEKTDIPYELTDISRLPSSSSSGYTPDYYEEEADVDFDEDDVDFDGIDSCSKETKSSSRSDCKLKCRETKKRKHASPALSRRRWCAFAPRAAGALPCQSLFSSSSSGLSAAYSHIGHQLAQQTAQRATVYVQAQIDLDHTP